jgi:hypothetical protein
MRVAILIAVLIVATSCHRRKPQPIAPPIVAAPALPAVPPAGPAAPTTPPPAAPAPPAPALAFENASQEFARANYPQAAQSYQQYLNLVPSGGRRDEALFHLGLIYSLPGDARQDWQRAGNYFGQIVTEFPMSMLRPAAQLILTLKGETTMLAAESDARNQRIRQLNTELERLIKIDSERRPR